jgi:hypothetical protein
MDYLTRSRLILAVVVGCACTVWAVENAKKNHAQTVVMEEQTEQAKDLLPDVTSN